MKYDAAAGCGFGTIRNFTQEGFVMMEMILLPANGTLPIGLNEFGPNWLVVDADMAVDVFPMLGGALTNPGTTPPNPR
jgi:hypothetical protein